MTMKALPSFVCSSRITCGSSQSRLGLFSGQLCVLLLISTWYGGRSYCEHCTYIVCGGTGIVMGWLCLPHQPDSHACLGSHDHRSFFSSHICGILHSEFLRGRTWTSVIQNSSLNSSLNSSTDGVG